MRGESPRVSVIVPLYNKADSLPEAMRTALTQSLSDIEIVIVDDGSTDDSLKIANSIARDDSRVVVVSQPNSGVGSARNRGIYQARGVYVAFLDPDDFYPDEGVLEDLCNAADRHGVPIAGGGAVKYVDGVPRNETRAFEPGYSFAADSVMQYSDYQFDYGFWRFIYDRNFLISQGILFPPYRRFQDPPFFVRAMSLAGSFAALKRDTYAYNVSTSTNWKPSAVLDVVRGMTEVLKIASELSYHPLAERTVRRFNAAHIQDALALALEDNTEQAIALLETMSRFAPGVGTIWPKGAPSVASGELLTNGRFLPSNSDEASDFQPDVSVVVPVYNASAWLHECLLSVLGQSGVSVEVVCVNDESSDDSLRILREYQAIDPRRVRIVDQPNGGLSVARNSGLHVAKGRYVCMLDSDDYWRLDALGAMVERMDAQSLDVLQFDAVPFPDAGVAEADWKRYSEYYRRSGDYDSVQSGAQLLAMQREANDYKPSACLYLVRRDLLIECQIEFVPGMMHEDNPYSFSILLNSKRAAYQPVGFYARRVRPGSIMTSDSLEKSMRGYFISYLRMRDEASRHDLEPGVARTIGRLLYAILSNVSARLGKVDDAAADRLSDLVSTAEAEQAHATLMQMRRQTLKLQALSK